MDEIIKQAFLEELENQGYRLDGMSKEASPLKFLTGLLTRAKASPWGLRMQSGYRGLANRVGQPGPASRWLALHPKTKKAIGFGTTNLGMGIGWSVGEGLIRKRPVVTQVLPADARPISQQYRGY